MKHPIYNWKHPLYSVWSNMKQRCYYLNKPQYKDYGGRGITVCDQWKNSSLEFMKWAVEIGKWKKGLQLNRIDNSGNYCHENCRFVTPEENMSNHRLHRLHKIHKPHKKKSNLPIGVYFAKDCKIKPYKAMIRINGKTIYLGVFATPELAHEAFLGAKLARDWKN